jgi:FlaA1/EpsC-like NDP-sugar epimerase
MKFNVETFAKLHRHQKVALQLATDAGIVTACVIAGMSIRLDSFEFLQNSRLWFTICALVPVTLGIFWYFDVYRAMVRFLTGRGLLAIAKGAFFSAFVLFFIGYLLGAGLPRSVPLIYAVLLFLAAGGIRFIARHLFRRSYTNSRTPVIIYGAGAAGRELLNALFLSRDYSPVAFVDDASQLQGLRIGGVNVHSPTEIRRIIEKKGCRHVFLAMPSATHARRLEIIKAIRPFDIKIKTIPNLADIISGRSQLSAVRDIAPEDLLGRDPVPPDPELLRRNIEGKVVLVSGAGGSIGSELCRQIMQLGPSKLVLYEISEFALYQIDTELRDSADKYANAPEILPILGSVQDSTRIEKTISEHCVNTIYHTAAYKHVPIVEDNIIEGIRNNIFGTLVIASAAKRLGVSNFTLISTDKAVRPTNIMGATKRVAELICQAYSLESSSTMFSIVRFGNVLGSTGSVIPRFKAQIDRGGPVTVTHADINRYFMTIPEASQLVIQAGALAQGGDVFVLDMGKPVKIMDLAIDAIRLHGLVPYKVDNPNEFNPDLGDIPIYVTGLRKGEKLYEELLVGNNPIVTRHPRIMAESEVSMTFVDLKNFLDQLCNACDASDAQTAISILRHLPINYEVSPSFK